MLYKKTKRETTTIEALSNEDGETIEQKIDRIVNNKEPIEDGAPLIYTSRKQGVLPEYDPRADKWDHAIDAWDKGATARLAEREERHKEPENKDEETSDNSGTSAPTKE